MCVMFKDLYKDYLNISKYDYVVIIVMKVNDDYNNNNTKN